MCPRRARRTREIAASKWGKTWGGGGHLLRYKSSLARTKLPRRPRQIVSIQLHAARTVFRQTASTLSPFAALFALIKASTLELQRNSLKQTASVVIEGDLKERWRDWTVGGALLALRYLIIVDWLVDYGVLYSIMFESCDCYPL